MPSELFEQKIRDKVNEARMVPPAEVWQAIEGQISPQPNRRRPLGWWLGGSSLLGAALIAGWLLWPTSPSSPTPAQAEGESASVSPSPSPAATNQADAFSALSDQVPALTATADQGGQSDHRLPPTLPPEENDQFAASTPQPSTPVATREEVTRITSDQVVEWSASPSMVVASHQSFGTALSPQSVDESSASPIEQVPPLPACGLSFASPSAQATVVSVDLAGQNRISPSPWSFRVSLQPEWAGRGSLRNFTTDPSVDHSILETDSRLIRPNVGQVYTLQYPRRSFSLNLGVGYRFARRWELVSGLSLMRSEVGQLQRGTIDLLNLYEDGPRAEEVVQAFDLIMHWRQTQLEIPLAFSFEALRLGRHRLYLMAGASADVIINTPIESFDLGQEVDQPSIEPDPIFNPSDRSFTTPKAQTLLSLRQWHAHLDARLWYAYQVAPRVQLYLGPTAKYHLRGAYDGLAARDQMKYRLGWELGLRFGQ